MILTDSQDKFASVSLPGIGVVPIGVELDGYDLQNLENVARQFYGDRLALRQTHELVQADKEAAVLEETLNELDEQIKEAMGNVAPSDPDSKTESKSPETTVKRGKKS